MISPTWQQQENTTKREISRDLCFPYSKFGLLGALSLRFIDKGLVDVRNDTSTGNCCLDKRIQFFVTTNSKLQMAGCDTLDLEILAGVSSQLQDFGSQVLKNGRSVDSSCGSHSMSMVNGVLQETVDTTNGELKSSL